MERAEALKSIEGIPYPSERALEDDKRYFLKKMGWTPDQLAGYLKRPAQPHQLYGSERGLWDLFARVYFSFAGKAPHITMATFPHARGGSHFVRATHVVGTKA